MKGFKIPWLMSFLAQGVTALAFQLGLFISPSWNAAGIPNLGWNLPAQRATNFSEQLRNYTFIYSRGLTISVHSTSCLPCPPLVFVSCNHFFSHIPETPASLPWQWCYHQVLYIMPHSWVLHSCDMPDFDTITAWLHILIYVTVLLQWYQRQMSNSQKLSF